MEQLWKCIFKTNELLVKKKKQQNLGYENKTD